MIDQQDKANGSRASYFFRASLLAWLLLIVYASWYPFTGWRDIGVPPLAYS
ncbi:MAG: hypothetical protein H6R04_1535 [Burkholderiaceae bacterium]|nr:hypothetical protein [Burkholderiaceae bacterium]